MSVRRPTGWGLVDLLARLAILAGLLYAWHADDNRFALVLVAIIFVWSVTSLVWTVARNGRV